MAYGTENVLTQTLCDAFYQSNPNVVSDLQNHPNIKLTAISDFGKNHITDRAAMYVEIAKLVWATP